MDDWRRNAWLGDIFRSRLEGWMDSYSPILTVRVTPDFGISIFYPILGRIPLKSTRGNTKKRYERPPNDAVWEI